MYVKGLGEIEAVAFDIDGTLYPQWRLTVRALFRYIAHGFFFLFSASFTRRIVGDSQENGSRIAREVTTQVVFCPKKPVWLGTIVGGMMPSVRP